MAHVPKSTPHLPFIYRKERKKKNIFFLKYFHIHFIHSNGTFSLIYTTTSKPSFLFFPQFFLIFSSFPKFSFYLIFIFYIVFSFSKWSSMRNTLSSSCIPIVDVGRSSRRNAAWVISCLVSGVPMTVEWVGVVHQAIKNRHLLQLPRSGRLIRLRSLQHWISSRFRTKHKRQLRVPFHASKLKNTNQMKGVISK